MAVKDLSGLDPEALKIVERYAGKNFAERRTISVEAYRVRFFDSIHLFDFIRGVMNSVPSEFVGSAFIESDHGYYDEGLEAAVKYDRPETDDEVNERIDAGLLRAKTELDNERNTYQRLRKKFEGAKE